MGRYDASATKTAAYDRVDRRGAQKFDAVLFPLPRMPRADADSTHTHAAQLKLVPPSSMAPKKKKTFFPEIEQGREVRGVCVWAAHPVRVFGLVPKCLVVVVVVVVVVVRMECCCCCDARVKEYSAEGAGSARGQRYKNGSHIKATSNARRPESQEKKRQLGDVMISQ